VSVALYMDVHVPAAITRSLAARNVDVMTAQMDGASRLADKALLDRAGELGRSVFTRDEDFLAEANERQRRHVSFAGVIYAHQLRVTIGQCVADLELITKCCEPAELTNTVLHLPLR
jgi:predicted nuclease of predicted toxin-antitoxin system